MRKKIKGIGLSLAVVSAIGVGFIGCGGGGGSSGTAATSNGVSTIDGYVIDDPVPNATVTFISQPGNNILGTATTDAKGKYSFELDDMDQEYLKVADHIEVSALAPNNKSLRGYIMNYDPATNFGKSYSSVDAYISNDSEAVVQLIEGTLDDKMELYSEFLKQYKNGRYTNPDGKDDIIILTAEEVKKKFYSDAELDVDINGFIDSENANYLDDNSSDFAVTVSKRVDKSNQFKESIDNSYSFPSHLKSIDEKIEYISYKYQIDMKNKIINDLSQGGLVISSSADKAQRIFEVLDILVKLVNYEISLASDGLTKASIMLFVHEANDSLLEKNPVLKEFSGFAIDIFEDMLSTYNETQKITTPFQQNQLSSRIKEYIELGYGLVKLSAYANYIGELSANTFNIGVSRLSKYILTYDYENLSGCQESDFPSSFIGFKINSGYDVYDYNLCKAQKGANYLNKSEQYNAIVSDIESYSDSSNNPWLISIGLLGMDNVIDKLTEGGKSALMKSVLVNVKATKESIAFFTEKRKEIYSKNDGDIITISSNILSPSSQVFKEDENITFLGSGYASDSNVTFKWSGDISSTNTEVSKSFKAGQYEVTFTVTDENGEEATSEHKFVVVKSPTLPTIETSVSPLSSDNPTTYVDEVTITLDATLYEKLYYELNGVVSEYTKPFKITEDSTLKVFSYYKGQASDIVTKKYKIIEKPNQPSIDLSAGTYTIENETDTKKISISVVGSLLDEIIYTTDGTTPSLTNGTKTTSTDITLSQGTTTIKAVSVNKYGVLSDVVSGTYVLKMEEEIVYLWTYSDWSVCTGSCGTDNGKQTRTVTCKDSNGNSASDSMCTDTKPATTQSCTASECEEEQPTTSAVKSGQIWKGKSTINIYTGKEILKCNYGLTLNNIVVSGSTFTAQLKTDDSYLPETSLCYDGLKLTNPSTYEAYNLETVTGTISNNEAMSLTSYNMNATLTNPTRYDGTWVYGGTGSTGTFYIIKQ